MSEDIDRVKIGTAMTCESCRHVRSESNWDGPGSPWDHWFYCWINLKKIERTNICIKYDFKRYTKTYPIAERDRSQIELDFVSGRLCTKSKLNEEIYLSNKETYLIKVLEADGKLNPFDRVVVTRSGKIKRAKTEKERNRPFGIIFPTGEEYK